MVLEEIKIVFAVKKRKGCLLVGHVDICFDHGAVFVEMMRLVVYEQNINNNK